MKAARNCSNHVSIQYKHHNSFSKNMLWHTKNTILLYGDWSSQLHYNNCLICLSNAFQVATSFCVYGIQSKILNKKPNCSM